MPPLIATLDKQRLDKFLAEQANGVTRGIIQKSIESGLVFVNEKQNTNASHKIKKGDKVRFELINTERKPQTINLNLKVLYESRGLAIIDKPAGLSVHPGSGIQEPTLSEGLLHLYPGISEVGEEHRSGIVHRLDKDTSGCLLVALTLEVYKHLTSAFAERRVKKEYLALVWGHMDNGYGIINTPMGKSKLDFRKQTTKDPVEAKEALTEYSVISNFQFPISNPKFLISKFDELTLIKVKLHTGRTHQIRVHMASISHPIVGDRLYGPKKQLPGLHRQFLHAQRIEVQLPDETWIEAESGLPEDLVRVISSLDSK